MQKAIISLLLLLVASPVLSQKARWLSADDINKVNQKMDESSRKSSAAEELIKKREKERPVQVETKKNVVTYVPTANDVRRQAEAEEASRLSAIATTQYQAQLQEERRQQEIALVRHQERQRQDREYQLRAQELQLRQQYAQQQEARLRLLEQMAAQQAEQQQNYRPPAQRTLHCFTYGPGQTVCN